MNNEEKIFSLLEKVYIELQDTKKELKDDIVRIEGKIDDLQIQLNSLTAKTALNENKIIELSNNLKRVK